METDARSENSTRRLILLVAVFEFVLAAISWVMGWTSTFVIGVMGVALMVFAFYRSQGRGSPNAS